MVGDIDINILYNNNSVCKPFTWDQFAIFSPCDRSHGNVFFFKFPCKEMDFV